MRKPCQKLQIRSFAESRQIKRQARINTTTGQTKNFGTRKLGKVTRSSRDIKTACESSSDLEENRTISDIPRLNFTKCRQCFIGRRGMARLEIKGLVIGSWELSVWCWRVRIWCVFCWDLEVGVNYLWEAPGSTLRLSRFLALKPQTPLNRMKLAAPLKLRQKKHIYIYIYIYYIYVHIYIYICIYIYKNISAENVDVEKYGQHGLQISLFHLACRFGMKPVSHQVRWLPATICAICDATASHFFPLDT
jgi:hypothetical protein